MCLILLAHQGHSHYPLILAANRDEYYVRPTLPLDGWDDRPDIIAGRDLIGGGTWLGVNRAGRIAAVTNFRDPGSRREDALSRGLLVSDFLRGNDAPAAYLARVSKQAESYNGFSLLVGDESGLFYYSNRGSAVQRLPAGIHGLSNHLLNTPWPKVDWGKRKLEALLDVDPLSPDAIFALLANTNRFADEELPSTGIELAWERALSPLFIASEEYGTRSSSVILVDRHGNLTFCERTFAFANNQSCCTGERKLAIELPIAFG